MSTLLVAATFASAAPTLNVSPGSIATDETTAVGIDVSGLLGSELVLRLWVDADGDGVIDPEDYPVWADVLDDNLAPWSPAMPADTDPAVGAVSVDLRYFGPFGFPYTGGTFVWQAVDPFDASTTTTGFAITQAAQSQSVSGIVTDEDTALPIPGALVLLEPFCDTGEEASRFYSAFADDSGSFSIQIPDALDCNHRLLVALAPGYVTPLLGLPHLVFDGSDNFAGQDLELTAGDRPVSGSVLYDSGPFMDDGIPGLAVFVELEEGPPFFALAFTDEDGGYDLMLVDGSWAIESPESGLDARGAVGIDGELEFDVAGAPLVLPDIYLPAANAFFQGTLSDDAGVPLAAQWVSAFQSWPCDPDCHFGEVLTGSDGSFTLGVVAAPGPATTEYNLNIADPLPGLVAEQRGCLTISEGQTLTGTDLQHIPPTGFISGDMANKSGAPLEKLCLDAWSYGATCNSYRSSAVSSCDGSYALPVVDGDWEVRLEVEDIAAVYRDLDDTEVSRSLTIAGGGSATTDFIVGRWMNSPTLNQIHRLDGPTGSHVLLEGFGFSFGSLPTVFFDGLPASLIEFRPDLGGIIAEVPAPLATGEHAVTVFNPDLGRTSNALCHETLAGGYAQACTIDGTVTDFGSLSVVPGALVLVFDDEGEEFLRANVTDSNGDYSISMEQAGDYAVIFIPPQGQPWSWGLSPVTCGATLDHAFAPGWQLSGRVVSDSGDSIASAIVEVEGASGYFAFATTDDDGHFSIRVPSGDYDVFFDPPPGSRFTATNSVQLTVGGDTDLGQITMNRGFYFIGSVRDAAGDGLPAEVEAYRRSDGLWSGLGDTHPCSGRIDLALPAGEFRLDLLAETLDTDGPTEVKWVEVEGDGFAQFDFVVYDRGALQLTGNAPRVKWVEPAPRGQVGQPLLVFAENISGTAVEVLFSDGAGGFVTGSTTLWDPARGLVVTRIPGGAQSGELMLRVDGLEGPGVGFALDPGIFPVGSYGVSGVVSGPGGPVEDTFVGLFWVDPGTGGCDEDDGVLVDYAMTDLAGGYGSLLHPGGDLFVAFMPPTGTTLAASGAEEQSVFSPRIVDGTLVNGVPVSIRAVDAEPVPNPLAGVLFEYEGEVGFGDWRLTDANGDATLYIEPELVELALVPPVGSRSMDQEWEDTIAGPLDYGDRTLVPGSMLGSAVVREDDGEPIAGATIEAQRDSEPYDFFFESLSAVDGAYAGPVAAGSTFQIFIEPPTDDLADFRKFGLVAPANDRIVYPAIELGAAGFVQGTIRDGLSLVALSDIDINGMVDAQGSPGSSTGWARSCPDGTYRMKLAVGDHYLQVNGWPPNGYVTLWYPDGYCGDEAAPLSISAGATVTADFDLGLWGSLSGSVTLDGDPLEGAGVCATSDTVGSCMFCGEWTDASGSYSLTTPQAADFRVESWAPGLSNQCFSGYDDCTGYSPVPVASGSNTAGIDFAFGCSSGSEVSMDDLEAGTTGWTAGGLWHLGTDPACAPAAHSGNSAFYYGTGSCNYDTGGPNSGTLTSPVENGVPAGVALTFWQRRETDGNCFGTDRSRVLLSVNGSDPFQVWEDCDDSDQWSAREIDLTPYYIPGDSLQVSFEFNSVDASDNQHTGWMIDDVRLFACVPDAPAEPSADGSPRPLRMADSDGALVIEQVPGATAYNVYVDQLGSYYSPSAADGTSCRVTSWIDNGDGTLTLDLTLPADVWVAVSASNAGGESSVGRNGSGVDRKTMGVWESCSLGP